MDPEGVKRLRRTLTLHFAILSWLTSMLVASGSGSYFLPVLIFFVSLAGLIFVDTLEWFELGKIASYIAMAVATVVAVGGYLYSVFRVESETGQLVSVAGLLVYPECVLFLQRKNRRVYEQLAIFLLLEMIVAALINDNLLFGLLLTPIMLLWVSSLFLFSRYATLMAIDPTIDQPLPLFVELLYQNLVKPMFARAKQQASVTSSFQPKMDVQLGNPIRRALQTLPIGIGAIIFAAAFFYLLPRTSIGSFRAGVGVSPKTGLPDEMRMGVFGRLLQDPTAVMRVTFSSMLRQPYRLEAPPYLRARVFDTYSSSNSRSNLFTWRGSLPGRAYFPNLLPLGQQTAFAKLGQDMVIAEFDIRRQFARDLYSIPPAFLPGKQAQVKLAYDAYTMLLQPFDPGTSSLGSSLIYEIGSVGFAGGRQLPVVPATIPAFAFSPLKVLLLEPVIGFKAAEEYRLSILKTANCPESDRYRAAKAYEKHFVYSGDFTYSLDLRPPSDPTLDPVEDFIVNQRQGHCQYFASAMVAMLRRNGIPSRIVAGYRPTEFNGYGYFSVRQSDAHAWVEGLFTRKQLVGTELERWLMPEADGQEYWVLFDPTPASEGGEVVIVEQPGQAMDYAQKLWKDYVVDAQKLSGENSIYAPVAKDGENAYSSMIDRVKLMIEDLRSGRFLENRATIDFAWPIAIAVFAMGGLGIALWRLAIVLPSWAPNLAKRLGLKTAYAGRIQEDFYARCIEALQRQGLHRSAAQTPQEFTEEAASILAKRNASSEGYSETKDDARSSSNLLAEPLELLTQSYYRLRFGDDQKLSQSDRQEITQALKKIEATLK